MFVFFHVHVRTTYRALSQKISSGKVYRIMTLQQPVPTAENLLLFAENKISRGLLQDAQGILKQMVAKMPINWRPAKKQMNGKIQIAFWDIEEEARYISYIQTRGTKKKVTEPIPSYSKAYYLLACLADREKRCDEANKYINKAIALEPDHPELLCKKAEFLAETGSYKDAYDLYVNAVYSRGWNSNEIQAKAMRGAGIVLEEMGSWEEASNMFKASLELEPGHPIAMNELSHIYLQRMGIIREVQKVRKVWWKFW